MDAAEAWLAEHDPAYERSRQAWKDLDGGVYKTPPQEIPWGSAADLALLVDTGQARSIESVETKICERCGDVFAPALSWHRFCSEICQQAARKRKRRRSDYMRTYRAGRNAA